MDTLDIDKHGHQPLIRRLCACALCFFVGTYVFRWDVRLDVRFSLGRTFRRTFYLDKYVSIFDTDGLPYGHYTIQGLAGGGYYSRVATIRGRRLIEEIR